MLLDTIIGVVEWVINTSLDLLIDLVPDQMWGWLQAFVEGMGVVITAGPVGMLSLLFVVHFGVDLALNAYIFSIEAYKLIPFKAS